MSVFETGAEELAYERGFQHGEESGIYIGEGRAEERIITLLEPHRMTTKSVSGFLGVCSCGEPIDDYQEHLIALIKGESN